MSRALSNAFLGFTLLFLLLVFPLRISADTLFVSPLVATYAAGETFSVRIMVSSPSQSINAISGVLNFPIDKLQVVSVSKIGSVLSLWVQEPFFSNSRGTVTFEGVVPNPGFSESNGRVLAVNFRVVGTGQADVRLTSGSLLANDGYGTNVLKTLGSASYTLEDRQIIPVTPSAIDETIKDSGGLEESSSVIDLGKLESKEATEFDLPPWNIVWDWLLKFLSVVIPLVALLFFLIHTMKRGVGNIRALRKNLRKDLRSIDRIAEKAFDILKDDMTDIVHMLEHTRAKRKLTTEENVIVHRLKQNLVDSERLIQAEIAHAEKDLDD